MLLTTIDKHNIFIDECPSPHSSKQNPWCSPLIKELMITAIERPGTASILTPNEYNPREWITSIEYTINLTLQNIGIMMQVLRSNLNVKESKDKELELMLPNPI